MRSLLSFVALVVAVLAVVVALPAAWVAQHVSDEDGFVSSARAVTDSDAVRDATADVVAERLVSGIGVPDGVADSVASAVSEATDRALAGTDVRRAWEETLRRTHERVLAPGAAASDTLPLDLTPLAELVAERTDGLVQAPDEVVVDLPDGPDQATVDAVRRAPDVALVAGATAGVAALLALLLARRRAGVVLALGVGLALAAAADAGIARALRDRAVEQTRSQGEGAAQADLTRAFLDVAVDSFDGWLVWTALTAGVVVVLGVVGLLVRRA